MSRCHRKIVAGVTISRIGASQSAGSIPASRASHARSGHVNPNEREAARAGRQRTDGAASGSQRPSTTHPAGTSQHRHDTGDNEKDQLQATSRNSSHGRPRGPPPPTAKTRVLTCGLLGAYAQVACVFGTRNNGRRPHRSRHLHPPRPTTLSRTSPRSRSSAVRPRPASSTNTSGPHRSQGQERCRVLEPHKQNNHQNFRRMTLARDGRSPRPPDDQARRGHGERAHGDDVGQARPVTGDAGNLRPDVPRKFSTRS